MRTCPIAAANAQGSRRLIVEKMTFLISKGTMAIFYS